MAQYCIDNHISAILGVSGLSSSIRFKHEKWPALEEREYRISQGHDAAAALIVNGQIVAAAAEERFNRHKHSNAFPSEAARFCLRQAGLKLNDLSEIAHAFNYAPYEEIYSLDPVSQQLFDEVFSREALLDEIDAFAPEFGAENIHQVSHHLSHAASAYFASGWNDCLTVVIDAMGETQGASIYEARHGDIRRLTEISVNDSIGILYSLVTLHLGFDFNSDEYKIMGLAPYGDPRATKRSSQRWCSRSRMDESESPYCV